MLYTGTSSWLVRAAVWLLLPGLALSSPAMACACVCAATDSPAGCCAADAEIAAESCCCDLHGADCACSPQQHHQGSSTGGCECTVQVDSPTVPGGPAVQVDPPLAAGWMTGCDHLHPGLSDAKLQTAWAADIPIRNLVIELRVLRI
ncbi:MAG: hypothetical protein SGJ19_03365 [Planctomycetia bacterium]|nr:hypothetical protein [Planctomycetia bacterium]